MEGEIEDHGLQLRLRLGVQRDLEIDLPLIGVGEVPLGELRGKRDDRNLALRPRLPAVPLPHLGADHLPRSIDVVPPHGGQDELLREAEDLILVRPERQLHVRLPSVPPGDVFAPVAAAGS